MRRKVLVKSYLKGHYLWDILDESAAMPLDTLNDKDVKEPEKAWNILVTIYSNSYNMRHPEQKLHEE